MNGWTDDEILAEARNYARASGRDPATITTPQQAREYMQRIADDCKQWGSD